MKNFHRTPDAVVSDLISPLAIQITKPNSVPVCPLQHAVRTNVGVASDFSSLREVCYGFNMTQSVEVKSELPSVRVHQADPIVNTVPTAGDGMTVLDFF